MERSAKHCRDPVEHRPFGLTRAIGFRAASNAKTNATP
jgi:hypothetical protein